MLIASVFTPHQESCCRRHCLHILHHYVLVRDKAIDPIVPSFPPVFRCSMIQEKGSSFFEREFSCRSSNVVKLGYSFYGLTLWVGREKEWLSDSTQCTLASSNPLTAFSSCSLLLSRADKSSVELRQTSSSHCNVSFTMKHHLCPKHETFGYITADSSGTTDVGGREGSTYRARALSWLGVGWRQDNEDL